MVSADVKQVYILPFEEIGKEDVAIAGGKGANLGEMTRAGFPVPPGAVLSTEAYDSFLVGNLISTERRDFGAGDIRSRILAGRFPEDVRKEIHDFYRKMEGQRLAVRSSATAEDLADSDFAGQQETYLNIRDEETLFSRIRDCYASLYAEKAVNYRKSHGYGKRKVKLAVILQVMADSDSSGVLFTRNPLQPVKDEMLINSSYGLGESVVSGRVSPDEIVCRCDGSLVSIRIGLKKTQLVYADSLEREGFPGRQDAVEKEDNIPENGIVEIPVPEDEQRMCSLTREQVEALSDLGMNVEVHYGRPMDIEWAFAGDTLWLLQARSITAGVREGTGRLTQDEEGPAGAEGSGAESAPEEEKTAAEAPAIRRLGGKAKQRMLRILEKYPEAAYPLDYDFGWISCSVQNEIQREAGLPADPDIRMDDNGFTFLSAGKREWGRRIFRAPSGIWTKCSALLRISLNCVPQARGTARKRSLRDLPIQRTLDHEENLRVLKRVRRKTRESFIALREERRRVQKVCRAGPAQESGQAEKTVSACVSALLRARQLIRQVSYIRIKYALLPVMLESREPDRYLKTVGTGHSTYELLGGLPYKTAVISWELAALAEEIRASEPLMAAFAGRTTYAQIRQTYPEIGEKLEAFLKRYGKRQDLPGCCFAACSWKEDPDHFLDILRPMLSARTEDVWSREKGKLQYERLLRDLHDSVGREKYVRLEKKINRCRKYQVFQEDGQYLLESIFCECRRLLSCLAQLVCPESPGKLLFLRLEELGRLGRSGALTEDLREIMDRRQAMRRDAVRFWERQKAEILRLNSPDTDMAGELQVHGIPASIGQASGKVCILKSPDEFSRMEKGDILVCPYLAPEWLTLFPLAGAIVCDTGSRISCAAIAAADYEMPAVLGCGNATGLLSDGEEVIVNGRTGVIRRN